MELLRHCFLTDQIIHLRQRAQIVQIHLTQFAAVTQEDPLRRLTQHIPPQVVFLYGSIRSSMDTPRQEKNKTSAL